MAQQFGLITDGGLPPSNSFVLTEHKIAYISVTKAACSSLRWMMADLGGEDPEAFYNAPGPHVTRLMTVHTRRGRWDRVGRLSDMPPEEVEQVSVGNGWFIFAVVRDPWSRLWSAWQSKLLARHTLYVRRYADEPWFPRIPEKPEDVVADFQAFVDTHPWTWHEDLSRDAHFWPQVRSVRPDGLEYSKVYDLSAMAPLISDIHAHLAGLGKDTELYLPRVNETPLALTADVLADAVAERIRELYAKDFARFGDRWHLDDVKTVTGWSPDALRAVAFQAEVFERIFDLSRQVRSVHAELIKTQRELQDARHHAPDAAPPSPSERLRTGLGKASRAVRPLRPS